MYGNIEGRGRSYDEGSNGRLPPLFLPISKIIETIALCAIPRSVIASSTVRTASGWMRGLR
jgi:hypothetical protein